MRVIVSSRIAAGLLAMPLLGVTFSLSAHADVMISSDVTKNMSCGGGVCTPTAKNAVLNVNDLTNMLSASALTVNTGGATSSDIYVKASFSWASANGLTLDAYRSIRIEKSVSDSGPASLTLLTDDGGSHGSLSFGSKGSVSFLGTSNVLAINGQNYTLVNSIASLASAIAANPAGNYALSASYNARPDGTYSSNPVETTFAGVFEGLGNSIMNFSLSSESMNVALITETAESAVIRDLVLANVDIQHTEADGGTCGALVDTNIGQIVGVSVSGSVSGYNTSFTGGITAENYGSVLSSQSYAATTSYAGLGGIVGLNRGKMSHDFASGPVSSSGGPSGGLVGENTYNIADSRAGGTLTTSQNGDTGGGLVGLNAHGTISNSSATGAVAAGLYAGGLVGWNEAAIQNSHAIGATQTTCQTGCGEAQYAGGLVGLSGLITTITNSYATGAVTGNDYLGGLVGGSSAAITGSYATGEVDGGQYTGGLVGSNGGSILNSYATGSVEEALTDTASLVGYEDSTGTIAASYGTGAVKSGAGSTVGGALGFDASPNGSNDALYWDTTTTGITDLSQGAGNIPNDPGITGLTNAQLQSGLPAGFAPTVWTESPNVNGGLPYLIANPPSQRQAIVTQGYPIAPILCRDARLSQRIACRSANPGKKTRFNHWPQF